MRSFIMYRKADISQTHDSNQVNPADEPQFEGVVFSDGKCAIRWLTNKRSVSVWDCFEDMMAIHGHPEYGSILVWMDRERNIIDKRLKDISSPHFHHREDGTYYNHSHKGGDIPHGHHGSRYGQPLEAIARQVKRARELLVTSTEGEG